MTMSEKSWEEMSTKEKDVEWYALSDREKTQFYSYRDARESLKKLRIYIDRELAGYKYPTDLISHVASIRVSINTWAGEKWTAAVDEVLSDKEKE